MTRAVLVSAPAKLNLRLDVLGRRGDGWHELSTVLVALDLADRVEVRRTRAPGVALRVAGPQSRGVPTDGTNLASRAASAVLAHARRSGWGSAVGIALEIDKRIPSEAGLGGGSSDAVAAWLGAEHVLDIALPASLRRAGLAALGSDCPFFAEVGASGLALCLGRGERVEPAPSAPSGWAFALLTPDVRCPTGEIYEAADLPLGAVRSAPGLPIDLFGGAARDLRDRLGNELENAARRVRPELVPWRELLDEDEDARWVLSGSGSSFFALLPNEASAREVLVSATERARVRGLAPRFARLAFPGPGPRFLLET